MHEVVELIGATPEAIYAMVTDVTRMGEWSPETYRCRWLDGASGPAVGARFKGWNKFSFVRWATTCEVEVAMPGEEFTFSTRYGRDGRRVGGRWSYRFNAVDGGTEVREINEAIGVPLPHRIADKLLMPRHAPAREEGMRKTLQRIKAAAENPAPAAAR